MPSVSGDTFSPNFGQENLLNKGISLLPMPVEMHEAGLLAGYTKKGIEAILLYSEAPAVQY